MAMTSPGFEHKVLVRAKDGIIREDGKKLFGSFEQRYDELVHEGWRVTMTWPRLVTFRRKTEPPVRLLRDHSTTRRAMWTDRLQ